MSVTTCLLVTDDPDDHQAFSEAFSEISANTIVLIILDSERALQLLMSKKYTPDYLFLDLSMHGIRINTFLKSIKSDSSLSALPAVVYGEESAFTKVEYRDDVKFFNKDYQYSELKEFLSDYMSRFK